MTDTQRLQWMIDNSARVCRASDDKDCWVSWETAGFARKETALHDDPRLAIDDAMEATA